jgi:hypothetical protein
MCVYVLCVCMCVYALAGYWRPWTSPHLSNARIAYLCTCSRYTHTHTHTHTHKHTHTHTYNICTYICMYIHTYVMNVYIRICVCIYIYVYLCACSRYKHPMVSSNKRRSLTFLTCTLRSQTAGKIERTHRWKTKTTQSGPRAHTLLRRFRADEWRPFGARPELSSREDSCHGRLFLGAFKVLHSADRRQSLHAGRVLFL